MDRDVTAAYDEAQARVLESLNVLRSLTNVPSVIINQSDDTGRGVTWSHVGSMTKVSADLTDLINFIAGTER